MKRKILSSLPPVLVLLVLTSCCTGMQRRDSASIQLFNGKDLNGWRHVLADPSVPKERVWSVSDGILVCAGSPVGFIYGERDFRDFRMEVEYRWPEGSKPGNSGIFSRINDASKALPRCVETQLMHGSAGDVLGLQGMKIDPAHPRYFHVAKHALAGDIDGVKKLVDAEAAPGQWNRVEIEAKGSRYTVWINGRKVNEVTGVETLPGPVGLQSEGGEIQFRKAVITPLPEG